MSPKHIRYKGAIYVRADALRNVNLELEKLRVPKMMESVHRQLAEIDRLNKLFDPNKNADYGEIKQEGRYLEMAAEAAKSLVTVYEALRKIVEAPIKQSQEE